MPDEDARRHFSGSCAWNVVAVSESRASSRRPLTRTAFGSREEVPERGTGDQLRRAASSATASSLRRDVGRGRSQPFVVFTCDQAGPPDPARSWRCRSLRRRHPRPTPSGPLRPRSSRPSPFSVGRPPHVVTSTRSSPARPRARLRSSRPATSNLRAMCSISSSSCGDAAGWRVWVAARPKAIARARSVQPGRLRLGYHCTPGRGRASQRASAFERARAGR